MSAAGAAAASSPASDRGAGFDGGRLHVRITEWRFITKVYRTVICCVLISALAGYMRSRYGL